MLSEPLQAHGVYQWVGPSMGPTLLGTRQGSLVLTGTHLAFVTAGGNDVAGKLVLATLAALVPAQWGVALGVADAARGPLSRLLSERSGAVPSTGPGSWLAPLGTVTRCVHVRRRFSSYLQVGIHGATGETLFALGRQVAFPEANDFEQWVSRLHPRR